MEKLPIEIGQYWRTRNGACLRVDAKVPNGWKVYYAQGITEVVDEYGRVHGTNVPAGFDLVEKM